MRGKLIFGAGAAIGYVLGTRAGRERFDQISSQAKRFWENDTVQETAGMVQARAGQLYGGSKKMVSEQAHKLREHRQEQQQHHMKRNKNFRNRRDAAWEAQAGFPANATTTPY
jgi:hypothetical protein